MTSPGPRYDELPDDAKPIIDETLAKVIDLLHAHPELVYIPAPDLAIVYQAGVIAGWTAASKVYEPNPTTEGS